MPGASRAAAHTYLHLPIIAGIIVYATSLKGVIKLPDELLAHHHAEITLAVAGPVLYVVGHNAFRLLMTGTYSGKRLVATVLMLASTLVAPQLTQLQYAALLLFIVATLTVWESVGVRAWYRQIPVDERPETLIHLERTVREPRSARRRTRRNQ